MRSGGTTANAWTIVYRPPTPRRLIATTNRPLTAPPRSAICSARFRLERAALAVRMLARTATNMPISPAIPEHSAPNTNDSVVQKAIVVAGGSPGCGERKNAYSTKISAARKTLRVKMVRYCRRRNAPAPS